MLHTVRELQNLHQASLANNLFAQSLGRPSREQAPPQNAALTRGALEEWERTICENKAVAILDRLQEGRPALFQQDGEAMLIATAEVLPSVSKVAGVWRGVSWCLESVMLWRGIMGSTKFGDKHVNDLDLL